MIITLDMEHGDVLRLDLDRAGIRGGWSPYDFNGDAYDRAETVGVDLTPPDGIAVDGSDPAELASLTAAWFTAHVGRYPTRERRRPAIERRAGPGIRWMLRRWLLRLLRLRYRIARF